MSREAVKTLFHPYASGVLDAPKAGEKVLFLGAEPGYALPDGFEAELVAVQGFRPLFLRLQAAHVAAEPQLPEETYAHALVLCGKHKGENEARIASALMHVAPGGMIVIAGSKEDGVQPLRKKLEKLGVEAGSMPKYHGLAIWFQRPVAPEALVAAFAAPPVRVEGRFSAAPGMFSHDRVDAGSLLLADRLPTDFNGNAADFGAGWGYLSAMLAERSPMVNRIDLYEADFDSLEQARANLAGSRVDTRFFWHDVAAETIKDRYELVIMNPPFHEGHAAEPGLGQAFIRQAATVLKGGGRLLLVANRGLPYEPVLAGLFRESGEVCRNARYKVLWAKK